MYKIRPVDSYFVATVCEIELRFLTPKKMNCHYGFVVCTLKVCVSPSVCQKGVGSFSI